MKRLLILVGVVCALCGIGCSDGPNTSTGVGGNGGTTVTTTSDGGGGTGGTGGCDPHDPSCIHYTPPDYSVAAPGELSADGLLDLGEAGIGCAPISRLSTEDGSWTRVVMTAPAGSYIAVRWIAMRGTGFAIPSTWQMSVGNLAPELDPDGVICGPGAADEFPYEVESVVVDDDAGNPAEFVVLESEVTSVNVVDGSRWVVCLRNYTDADSETEGPQPTAIIMCGQPDAGDKERDFWQDSTADGGAIHTMCSYGPNLCGGWMVTMLQ